MLGVMNEHPVQVPTCCVYRVIALNDSIDEQEELATRAIELLNLPDDQEHFILDVGCGSGLSGGASVNDSSIAIS